MQEVKKISYKYCIVPECTNTTRKTPEKVFFRISSDAKIRKQWCKVMRRDNISPKSCLYCCEDHFNVMEDTENYIEYKLMKEQGEKRTLRLKKGVLPHIFLCQKQRMPLPKERKAVVKMQRLTLVNEALSSEIAIKSSVSEPSQRSDHEGSPSTSHTNICDQPGCSTSRIGCDDLQKYLIPDLIAAKLKDLIAWPASSDIYNNLWYRNVVSIIDCLEIQIEKPSNAVHQSLTWSQYKKCNTLKYFISCTPDVLINFFSDGYGGRAADVMIVQDSSYLQQALPPNKAVMAERGFKDLSCLPEAKRCTLIRPPSVSKSTPSTKNEVELSKRIAALRIHVERVIYRLREFHMLCYCLMLV
ncbi:unnamed protein product [Colias eurytheme]|nr:unnamed protein product [Colias eurytheme]